MQPTRPSRVLSLMVTVCASLALVALGNSAQASDDSSRPCVGPSSAVSDAPSGWDRFTVVHTRNLYRVQRRPHARFPHGAALVVEVPAGVTASDVHRALESSSSGAREGDPAAVEGAEIEVRRDGSRYVVEITSPTRSRALEIQRRAAALSQ